MPRPPNPHPYRKIVTRWRMPDGKQVPARTEGAVKHTEKSSTYYADVAGKCLALKTTDIAIAWKRLRDLLREQHEIELGVRDRFSSHAKTPLLEHLTAWLLVLEAKGTAAGQRDTIERRLRKWFRAARWSKLAEISSEKAILSLAKLTRGGDNTGTLSVQTRNHYITHLRGFCAWLVITGRLPRNPVLDLEKVNVESDRRRLRREPSREEIAELFRYLDNAPVIRGMTGPQRALGYRVAMATGYRGGELRSLTVESFQLSAKTVTLPASEDKRRKSDAHPLPDWLAAELAKWFAQGGDTWQGFPEHFPGRVWKADLRRARGAWIETAADKKERDLRKKNTFLAYKIETADGPTFLDFHSLRVFYCSELAEIPGMDVKTLMALTRHSTPHLALKVYAKKRQTNIRAATDQLRPPNQ